MKDSTKKLRNVDVRDFDFAAKKLSISTVLLKTFEDLVKEIRDE